MKTKKIIIGTVLTIVALCCIGGFVAWTVLFSRYDGLPERVMIPRGSDDSDVRAAITGELGESFGSDVYRIWRLRGGKPSRSHGSYLVEPGTTAISVANNILNGRQTPLKFTFNNMRTVGQLAARAADVLELDSADFIAACDSILPQRGFAPAEFPAAFFPDTYEFYWTASPEKVIDVLLGVRSRFWDDARLAKAARLGLTPEQVATIASIVEEETNKADERPAVARLYLNRIARGMPLQADPTVKFALGDFGLRRITAAHLAVDSPYNTYKVNGLPPGPIRIVERSTIDAVLDAPPHDYLYMCARPDFSGYHDFAADYNRHRINAARYHRALTARGI